MNVLTAGSRGLETVFGQVTPADGEDVSGVVFAPVIEGPTPAVEHDEDLFSTHLSDSGRADQTRVLSVHCFQLHTQSEKVLQWLERLLTIKKKQRCKNRCNTDYAPKSMAPRDTVKKIAF